jgi:signal transduction histidine kinase
MRDPPERIPVRRGSRRCANLQPPANEIVGTLPYAIVTRLAKGGRLDTGSGAAPSTGGDGAPPLNFERSAARLPFPRNGTLLAGFETGEPFDAYPCAKPKPELAVKPEEGRNGAPTPGFRFIGSVTRDFTRQSGALSEAQLQVQELACANRRKDEFLATLSHELRSPLSAIRCAVHVLQGPIDDAGTQQRMQALIERQLGRVTRLVDELLDVSRITNGRLHLQRERVDLRVVVNNAIETLASDLNERNHRLVIGLPDAPVWLQADPCRLEQVFVNLVANASRYTDAGGELTVSMHAGDGQAVVRIRDSGIGIAPHALAHIFELFKQANEADPRSKAGLGVGLAVVRKLVELHEGSVSAASAGLGQGSEFTVRLRTSRPYST